MPSARTQKPVAIPLRADRIRRTDGRGFAYVPNAFLQDGFFTSMKTSERSLYLLYVLLGDRNGVSFLNHVNISALLGASLDEYFEARQSLIAMDLIATTETGTRVQVLSLPSRPRPRPPGPSSSQRPTVQSPPPQHADLPTPDYEHNLARLREILEGLDHRRSTDSLTLEPAPRRRGPGPKSNPNV